MISQVTATYADLYTWENDLGECLRRLPERGAAAAFTFHLEDKLCQLQQELAAESYTPVSTTASPSMNQKTAHQRGSSLTTESPVLF